MAVQLAKATTNARIAIVDIDENKLVEAKRLGADEIINSATGDPVKGVKEVTDGLGAQTVIDFVNNGKTAPNSLNMLRKRGRLVMVGLFGGSRAEPSTCSTAGVYIDRCLYRQVR